MAKTNNIYSEDGRQYLQMMQENITRMASNSANCKSWLMALISALFAIGASVDALQGWIFFTVVPVIMFWWLDAYYLKLERGMRNRQKLFINIVNNSISSEDDYNAALFDFRIYSIDKPDKEAGLVSTKGVAWTESILPFYGPVLLVVLAVSTVITFCA